MCFGKIDGHRYSQDVHAMRALKAQGMNCSPFAVVAEDMGLTAERKSWDLESDYYLDAPDGHCWEDDQEYFVLQDC